MFKEGDSIYHSKILSFYRKEPFELEASYESPEQVPSSNSKIGMQITLSLSLSLSHTHTHVHMYTSLVFLMSNRCICGQECCADC